MTKSSRLISSALLFASFAFGLEVAIDSPCAKRCLDKPKTGDPSNPDDSLTFNPDLSCFDWQYKGDKATTVGKKFADCQTCMQSSGYEDQGSGERDSGWYLFNNRGTVDWCIFGRFAEEENKDISTTYPYKQCNSKCQAIYDATDYRVKSSPTKYDFCDTSGDFVTNSQGCIDCLYDAKNMTILGNILSTLQEMCRTKPGKNVGFDDNIYTASRVTLSPASSTSGSASSGTSSSTSSSTPSSSSSKKGGISRAATAGIVLGALAVIAGVLAGVLLLLRRARNRRKSDDVPLKGNEAGFAGGPYAQSYNYDPVPQQQKDVFAYGASDVGTPAPAYGAPAIPYGAPQPYGAPIPYDSAAPAELGGQPTVVAELGMDERARSPAVEMGATSPTARTVPSELGPSSPTARTGAGSR